MRGESSNIYTRALSGQVAVITGAGRGIGRATTLRLASHGAKIVVNDIDSQHAEATAESVRASGGDAIAVSGNIVDRGAAALLIGQALKAFGGVDIVINNAGFYIGSPIATMTDADFDAMLDVHLVAVIRLLRAVAPTFRSARAADAIAGVERFRRVINVSSLGATRGVVNHSNYATAKGALIGLTRSLAKEWASDRVTVNGVAFGMIATRLTGVAATVHVGGRAVELGWDAARIEAQQAALPLGRAGTAEEAAGAIVMLCLPEADHVSGQVIEVTGGS